MSDAASTTTCEDLLLQPTVLKRSLTELTERFTATQVPAKLSASVYKSVPTTVPTTVVRNVRQKKQKQSQAIAIHADSLEFDKHAFLNPVYNNKAKGFKLVKVHAAKGNPHPLRIKFTNTPGKIPLNFGVDTNPHGKTYLTFAIPCSKEYDAMLRFQEDAKAYAIRHKSEWWTYPVTDSQIEDNFASLVTPLKEKKEGDGFWPGNMKVHIPLNDDGEAKDCQVLDEDGNPMSFHDLPGRKWESIMIEISGVYFQNRYNWGFGPKTLRLVQAAEDDSGSACIGEVDYLQIAVQGRADETLGDSVPIECTSDLKRKRTDDEQVL